MTVSVKDLLGGKPKAESVHHASQALIDWMYECYQPVWILSTGRAGSNFVAGLLKQSTNLQAHHEAEPRLEYFANYAFHNQAESEMLTRMVDAARMELVLDACVRDSIYVECNHALTAFAPALSRLFRRSRFVHLVRHPGDFVRSALRMGFHSSDTIWESGRIRMQDETTWVNLTQVDKLAWYWHANNHFLQEFKATLDEERFLLVTYEELIAGHRGVERLLEFIGGAPIPPENIGGTQSRKVNTLRSGEAPEGVRRTPHYPTFPCWSQAAFLQMKPYVESLSHQFGYELVEPPTLDQPLLSVVVPNHNGAAYLDCCLASLVQQTYPHLEILVVDDASTDSSREIVSRFADLHPERMRLISLPDRVGVARARNRGIEEARGAYLTTLDSDDFLLSPEKLEREIYLVMLHKARSGEDVIAFSDIVLTDAEGNPRHSQFGEEILREGSILKGVLTRSAFIPRDFVALLSAYRENGGYDPRFSTHEDWNLKIRMAARFKFYYTGLAGVAYRRHGEGLSSAPFGQKVQNLCQIFAENLQSLVPDVGEHALLREQFSAYLESFQRNGGQKEGENRAESSTVFRTLQAAAEERLALIERLENTCQERLDLIESLAATCEERLQLIHTLEETCQQRQALIEEQQAALQARNRNRH